MRIHLHYFGMMLIIPIYGIQVCPFIEGINPLEVFLTIDFILLFALLLRSPLLARIVHTKPIVDQAWWVFILELGILIAAGLLIAFYNLIFHDFPLASGLKVIVGIIAMGLFASTDSALDCERLIANKMKQDGDTLKISGNFIPLASKLAIYAGLYVLLIVGVFCLLVIKDLDWLVSAGSTIPLNDARTSILKEFGFVFIVTVLETINIILSFSANFNMFLVRQNSVLIKVASGTYHTLVPISSNDEFGVMAIHTNEMIRQIQARTDELNCTRDVTILTLASLAETRDNETGAHILRTQRYVRALAQQLRNHPQFSNELDDNTIDLLYKSAPLHDIGKVGIPDAILLKPGKLSVEEFKIMKGHAQIGADALKIAEDRLGTNSFLHLAGVISRTHHEKWDGSGYPAGLLGEEIPVPGRLMAVADVYDALITKRVYKPAFSHQKAMQILHEGRGNHFDPHIIDALDTIEDQFIAIAEKYRDADFEDRFGILQQAASN